MSTVVIVPDPDSVVAISAATTEFTVIEVSAAFANNPITFSQSSASSTWTFNHNLDRAVQVEVLDLAGNTVIADVSRPTSNTVVITHVGPATGSVIIR